MAGLQSTRLDHFSSCHQGWAHWRVALGLCAVCLGAAMVAYQGAVSRQEMYLAMSTQTRALPAHLSSSLTTPRGAFVSMHQNAALLSARSQGAGSGHGSMAQSLKEGQGWLLTLSGSVLGAMVMLVRQLFNREQPTTMSMMAVSLAEVDKQFPPMKNDNVLRAIRGQPVDRIPVWVMRQAGRYLPEYVEYTKDKEFFSRCENPEVACHLTLQPFDRYDLDAGIIFSDILVIPKALGMDVKMVKGQGPVFTTALRTKEQWYDIEKALLEKVGITGVPVEQQEALVIEKAPELVNALNYVYDAITLTRTRLNGRAPLIGFCGSPWTLFVYASEAKKTKTYTECSKLIYGQPEFVHRVLKVMAHICAQYLIRQVKAGAQLLQVFDSHANVLPPKAWAEFSLPYMELVAKTVKAECPEICMIALPKDAPFALEMLTTSSYDMVSLDPTLNLGKSHKLMLQHGKGVQGNLAPTLMYAPPEKLKEVVKETLTEAFGSTVPQRYIANLGSGMNPDMDPASLGAFVETVHAFGQK